MVPKSKYFQRLNQLDQNLPLNTDQEVPNPTLARQEQGEDRIATAFMTLRLWMIGLLQWLRPGIRLGPVRLITRPDHVLEIINTPNVFETPFGQEMIMLTGGRNVVLGMNDQQDHARQKRLILDAFQLLGRGERSMVHERLTSISHEFALDYLSKQSGKFNPIQDLFLQSMVEICIQFYGLKITDRVGFINNVLCLNALLFSDMTGREDARKLGIAGARGLHDTVDVSIQHALDVLSLGATPSTPIECLIRCHQEDEAAVPMEEVRAVIIGMITGFLPATVIAEANILEVLFEKKKARRLLERACKAQDNEAIQGILLEALRFRPIRPGPPRVANQNYLLKTKSGRKVQIREGDTLFATTRALMFDRRYVKNPMAFDPTRTKQAKPDDPVWMVYGPPNHFCIGAGISNAHMVGVFKALFAKPGLRKAGRLQRKGAYPDKIKLQYVA